VHSSVETEPVSLALDGAVEVPLPPSATAGPAFQPRVSVVVPVKNGAATIGQCLEALLGQDYPKTLTEILVIDSGSTDHTRLVVSRYPVTLLAEADVLTSYAARNCGIAHASGDVIAFTDADCTPDSELASPACRAAGGFNCRRGGWYRRRRTSGEPVRRVHGTGDAVCRPERRGLQTLLTGNVAVRRATLHALGRFDERLPTAGDVDLGWRMQQRLGLKVQAAAEARVIHHHRPTFRGAFDQYRRYG